MPALEVLEIGRNKINRLPSQPGSLVNLRVLSIYKNKITRLPSYFTQFNSLEVLRCEQNPLEWPPKQVIDTEGSTPDFVSFLKRWMQDPLNNERKRSLDEVAESPRVVVLIVEHASNTRPSAARKVALIDADQI